MVSTEEAQAMLTREFAKLRPHPVGTLSFRFTAQELSDPQAPGGVILEVAHGSHVFRVAKETTPCVVFYHWSPGTGSRCASVDVTGMEGSANVHIAITWCPQQTGLLIAPVGQPQGSERWAKGVPSQRQFRVTRTGGIVELGNHGMQVLQPTIFEDDMLVLEPTAIELWQGVIKSSEILLSGQSTEGYMFDVVQCNSVLIGLVTGFESYCKKRFVELEGEGILPNVAEDAMNFQDFDRAKTAYKKAYNIRFGNLGLAGNEINRLRRFIIYRHRIVHVSPILTPLSDLPEVASKRPDFPNKALACEAIEIFSRFIDLLHKATLDLRPPDQHALGQNVIP